jgi:hypothetical protein
MNRPSQVQQENQPSAAVSPAGILMPVRMHTIVFLTRLSHRIAATASASDETIGFHRFHDPRLHWTRGS